MAYRGHDRADQVERSERLVTAMLVESRRMVATVDAYRVEMEAHYTAMARLYADAASEYATACKALRRVRRALCHQSYPVRLYPITIQHQASATIISAGTISSSASAPSAIRSGRVMLSTHE